MLSPRTERFGCKSSPMLKRRPTVAMTLSWSWQGMVVRACMSTRPFGVCLPEPLPTRPSSPFPSLLSWLEPCSLPGLSSSRGLFLDRLCPPWITVGDGTDGTGRSLGAGTRRGCGTFERTSSREPRTPRPRAPGPRASESFHFLCFQSTDDVVCMLRSSLAEVVAEKIQEVGSLVSSVIRMTL